MESERKVRGAVGEDKGCQSWDVSEWSCDGRGHEQSQEDEEKKDLNTMQLWWSSKTLLQ